MRRALAGMLIAVVLAMLSLGRAVVSVIRATQDPAVPKFEFLWWGGLTLLLLFAGFFILLRGMREGRDPAPRP
jgi:Co/Zn/Cd efflux system component